MKFAVFQVSRRGGRPNNQDRMGYCYNRNSALFAVADGMGGHPEGQVAAQIALQAVSGFFQMHPVDQFDDPSRFLIDALTLAHREILAYTIAKNMADGPRTTLTVALVVDNIIQWIHCGDSRLYFARDGLMVERTRDHSYIEQPELMRHAEGRFVNRNILFTCIGSPADPIYTLSDPKRLQAGDRFVLCTDGLWANMADDEIVYEISRQSVAHSAPEIVEKALRRGGAYCDNVTVLVVAWEESVERVVESIFTETIGDEVYASTIAGDPSDEVVPLSDEAIEDSVAGINAAIRQAATGRS